MSVTEFAYAKLNLALDVLAKRPDGYHEMSMVMQSVKLCDTVTISKSEKMGVEVSADLAFIPRDGKNIAVKAAEAFFKAAGIENAAISIDIKKRIPVCAGLGGGSSDGAAVLRGLNRMFGAGFNAERLREIGKTVGSDVPFCVTGGTYHAGGRGEALTPLPPLGDCAIAISKPIFSVSTPELFSRIDCGRIHLHPDTEGMICALKMNSLPNVSRRMYNVFESVLTNGRDSIEHIKSVMLDNGAYGTVMTGTGSAVLGVFRDRQSAMGAFTELKEQYRDTFLTEPQPEIGV